MVLNQPIPNPLFPASNAYEKCIEPRPTDARTRRASCSEQTSTCKHDVKHDALELAPRQAAGSPFRVRSAGEAPRDRHTCGVAVPFKFQLPSLSATTHGSPRPRLSCCATRTAGGSGTPRSESSGQRTKGNAAGRGLWQPSPGLVWGQPSATCPSSAQKHRDPLPLLEFGL